MPNGHIIVADDDAAIRTVLWAQSSAAVFSAVNGGQTTTSGPLGPGALRRSSARNASVS